jgi:hypothetical protein
MGKIVFLINENKCQAINTKVLTSMFGTVNFNNITRCIKFWDNYDIINICQDKDLPMNFKILNERKIIEYNNDKNIEEYQISYNELSIDYENLQQKYFMLIDSYDKLNSHVSVLESTNKILQKEKKIIENSYQELKSYQENDSNSENIIINMQARINELEFYKLSVSNGQDQDQIILNLQARITELEFDKLSLELNSGSNTESYELNTYKTAELENEIDNLSDLCRTLKIENISNEIIFDEKYEQCFVENIKSKIENVLLKHLLNVKTLTSSNYEIL